MLPAVEVQSLNHWTAGKSLKGIISISPDSCFFPYIEKCFPGGSVGKESACQCRRHRFDPWSKKMPPAAGQLSACR